MLGFEHVKFMNWYLEYQTILLLKNLLFFNRYLILYTDSPGMQTYLQKMQAPCD